MALDFGSSASMGQLGTGLLGAGLGLASQFGNGGLAPGAQQGHINQQTTIAPWMQNQWQGAFGAQNAAAGSAAVAGLTPAQLQAMQGIQGSVGYGMPALQQAQGNAQSLAGGVGPNQIQNFMNPFQQTAIQSTLNTMQQQQNQQDAAISGQASQANAWGGDRSAVAQALNDQNWNLAQANTIGNMENQGYQSAVNSALNNQYASLAGNSQFANVIGQNQQANAQQYQNLLGVGNQQQAQNQNVLNLPILRAQLMGQNLNPATGSTTIGTNNYGTMQNPVTGALVGLNSGLQFGNALYNGLTGSNGFGGGAGALGGLSQAFGGSGNNAWYGSGYNDYTQAPAFNPGNPLQDFSNYDYGNQGLNFGDSTGFSAAGGEAANGMLPEVTVNGQAYPQIASDPQSTNNAQFAAYSAAAPLGGGPQFSVGSALGDASDALNIYSGLQRGGFAGDAGAALAGAKFGSSLSGTNIPGLGAVGGALGIYNGLRQHSLMGDATAAVDAASLLNSAGVGAGALAGAGAAALPLGLFAAQYGLFNKESAVTPLNTAEIMRQNATGLTNEANALQSGQALGYGTPDQQAAWLSGLKDQSALDTQWANDVMRGGFPALTADMPYAGGPRMTLNRNQF